MHDTDELTAPADPVQTLFTLSYCIQRLARIASTRPDVLHLIAEDMTQAYLLIVPAAEHVETALEVSADAGDRESRETRERPTTPETPGTYLPLLHPTN